MLHLLALIVFIIGVVVLFTESLVAGGFLILLAIFLAAWNY